MHNQSSYQWIIQGNIYFSFSVRDNLGFRCGNLYPLNSGLTVNLSNKSSPSCFPSIKSLRFLNAWNKQHIYNIKYNNIIIQNSSPFSQLVQNSNIELNLYPKSQTLPHFPCLPTHHEALGKKIILMR